MLSSCSKRSITLASRPLDFSRNASIPLENGSSQETTSSSFKCRAKQLLQTKDRIIDIAGNVGFENSKYFSQVFKKQTGMTPQEYRAAMQKEAEL